MDEAPLLIEETAFSLEDLLKLAAAATITMPKKRSQLNE